MLFSISLAQKLGKKGLLAFSLHPGNIWTGIGQYQSKEELSAFGITVDEEGKATSSDPNFLWKNPSQGASTYVVAAFDPSIAGKSWFLGSK